MADSREDWRTDVSAHKVVDTFVPGCPVPKGSLEVKGRNIRNVARVDDWVQAIAMATRTHRQPIVVAGRAADAVWTGPVYVVAEFVMPTLDVIGGGGRSKAGQGDLDKLQRAIGDGLQYGGAFVDDVQIVQWNAWKRPKLEGQTAGVRLEVWALMSWP